MPAVANVNFLAGTKAPLHAQQMLQILSVYAKVRHKGFKGEKCDMFQIPHELLYTRRRADGGNEVKQTGRERAAPCVSPTFADRKVTGEFLASAVIAAVRNYVWQMTQHLKTKSSDSLRPVINHVQYFPPFLPQSCLSSVSRLIWLFESFHDEDSMMHTDRMKGWIIWQVKGKHDSNETVHIFRARQDGASVQEGSGEER